MPELNEFNPFIKQPSTENFNNPQQYTGTNNAEESDAPPEYSLDEIDVTKFKTIKDRQKWYNNQDHSRWVFYDEVNKLYYKIWNDTYIRRNTIVNAFELGFYDVDMLPALKGLIFWEGICRGYVMKECEKYGVLEDDFFDDIKINLTDGLLSILVIENPIIEDIELTGMKSQDFLNKISENIVLKNRMSFTEEQLQKDITLIKNILKSSGFYFADVDSSLIKNKELNSVSIKLNINKGEKARIKEISFIGNKNVKDKKLLEVIASEEHKFWKFISNKVYLNQNLISLDKRLLINYYKNLGYHKVKVLNSFAEFNKEGYFKLVFNIESGKQYYFNKFELNLPEDYNDADFKKIKKR